MPDYRFPFPGREESRNILLADPCYGKIPPDETDAVFDRAWETGEKEALRFWEQWREEPDFSMLRVLEQKHFRIQTEDVDYVMGNIRYFCEYISERNIIRVYRKSVQLWADKNVLPYDTALELILAHEYFHYLEWHEIGRTSKQCLVPMLRLGPLSLGKTGISALSEIGANAFANCCFRFFIQKEQPAKQEE